MKPAAAPVRLDHVHVGVRDRRRAAAWYRRVLQLRTTYDYRQHGDAAGPLVLSGDGNGTHVALFVAAGVPKRSRTPIGTVPFRVPGRAFLRFVARLRRLDLRGPRGGRVTPANVVNHGNSYSVYVADPDGNPVAITSYDHGAVERAMKR